MVECLNMSLVKSKLSPTRRAIYLTNLLTSFHYFVVIYLNSVLLTKFISTESLSLLYIIGSVLSVLGISLFASAVKRVGNYYLAIILITIEIWALAGLAFATELNLLMLSFIVFLIISPLIYLSLDIFLERLTRDEETTGEVRGIFLTMQNITQVICPLLISVVLVDSEYWRMYVLSIGFLASALCLLALRLRHFNDARYHSSSVWQSLKHILAKPVIYRVVVAQWVLRFFYAWMVIYTPIYLYRNIGFDWPQIGVMFSIMLLPFFLFELPLGRVADSKMGEKAIMISGFILLIGSVLALPFISSPIFWLWTTVLFISRVGAASIEITTESYFFRHVDAKAADTISLFRMARPATYIAAASLAGLSLQFVSLQWSFIILGIVCMVGIVQALKLPSARR